MKNIYCMCMIASYWSNEFNRCALHVHLILHHIQKEHLDSSKLFKRKFKYIQKMIYIEEWIIHSSFMI